MAGMIRFASGEQRVNRDELVDWARSRFETSDLSVDDFKNKQHNEIRDVLVAYSKKHLDLSESKQKELLDKLESLFGASDETKTLDEVAGGNGAISSLSQWLEDTINYSIKEDDIKILDKTQLERKLVGAVDDHYRPEMRRMERSMLLHIVDGAWKDHLLAMDYLKSSVSLVGYAQVDPKVEYKREGMKLFENMWESIAQQTTDLIFRMEMLDKGFVGSTFKETRAVHEEGPNATELAKQQNEAVDSGAGGGEDQQIETIRNVGEKVRRNDPCPCGSGKKYKSCCLRKTANS